MLGVIPTPSSSPSNYILIGKYSRAPSTAALGAMGGRTVSAVVRRQAMLFVRAGRWYRCRASADISTACVGRHVWAASSSNRAGTHCAAPQTAPFPAHVAPYGVLIAISLALPRVCWHRPCAGCWCRSMRCRAGPRCAAVRTAPARTAQHPKPNPSRSPLAWRHMAAKMRSHFGVPYVCVGTGRTLAASVAACVVG